MTSVSTAGYRLATTRTDITAPDAAGDDMEALGFVEYGHLHYCDELLIEIAGTRLVQQARLNPMFGYWIGQDNAGRWALASSLGGWNVIGYVDRFDGAELADGEFYAIEHDDPADGPCSMVIRRASQDAIEAPSTRL